jgi:hypothetical protein
MEYFCHWDSLHDCRHQRLVKVTDAIKPAEHTWNPAGLIAVERPRIRNPVRSSAHITPYPYSVGFEPTTVSKHACHSINIANIPVTDILVKGLCFSEHPRHIIYFTGIPFANVLVERLVEVQ